MRRLMRLPPWSSASSMFVQYKVRSFQEVLRIVTYGLQVRNESISNVMLRNLDGSDAKFLSKIRKKRCERLAVR